MLSLDQCERVEPLEVSTKRNGVDVVAQSAYEEG